MNLFKFAVTFAWLTIAVGALRILMTIPVFIKEIINFQPVFKADFAAGIFQYTQLFLQELFFCVESISVGILILVVLKIGAQPISIWKIGIGPVVHPGLEK